MYTVCKMGFQASQTVSKRPNAIQTGEKHVFSFYLHSLRHPLSSHLDSSKHTACLYDSPAYTYVQMIVWVFETKLYYPRRDCCRGSPARIEYWDRHLFPVGSSLVAVSGVVYEQVRRF